MLLMIVFCFVNREIGRGRGEAAVTQLTAAAASLGRPSTLLPIVTSQFSVADPDPGSGAFLLPGSGIRIRDGAMVGSGSGIRDKTSRIRNTASRVFFTICP
jgi:hypothetical protein